MSIGKFSVKNPVLVNIAMVAILVLGAVSLIKLPREAFSNVDFSWVFIAVPYPGASAEEIEKSVIIEVEEEIKDIDRIKRISSTAEQGVGFIQVEFDDAISRSDFLRLFQDLRAEFDKVELPEGVMEPWVEEFSSADFMPIVTVNLKGSVSDAKINTAARDLRDRLREVPDVSKVEIVGGREREIWVEMDRDRMSAFGVTVDEVVQAIKMNNVNFPGGTIDDATRKYLLQVLGEVSKPDGFEKVIVRRRPGQGSIRVGDIGAVNQGLAESDYDVRVDGEKAISLLVSKTTTGNAIRIVDQIRENVDAFKTSLPAELSVHYFNDTSIFVRDTINTLSKNALAGFAMLVIVLLVFIGFRNSLITALGIPITFAITFVFMESVGETLNGNSLFALVMVLGMIVDHAIVIIENSYRHRQLGLSAADAAIKGADEVVKPVIAGTLTTVAAFLPLMLLPGIMGKFMRIIPIVVSLALAASTLEALFFLPAHFAEWGSKNKGFKEGFIGRWQEAFRRFMKVAIAHKYKTGGITLGVVIGSLFLTPLVKQDLFGGEEFPQFFVDIRMPMGTPREVTNEVATRFEQRLMPLVGNGEVLSITTHVGFMATDNDWVTASHVSQVTVDIAERKDGRERPVAVIMEDVKALCSNIPGAEEVNFRMVNNGPPQDKPVALRVQGENLTDMAAVATDVVNELKKKPELYNVDHDFDPGHPELRVVLNQERASELGLSAMQIGMFLRNSFEGVEATTFFEEDEEIDVKVRFAKPYRATVSDLNQLSFPTPDGRWIPFSSVATLQRGSGLAKITRVDQKRQIAITADALEGIDNRVTTQITQEMIDLYNERYAAIYPSITLSKGGQWSDFGKVFGDILRLFALGLFLMYVILGTQFKSYFQPFIIGAALFFAGVGCILFLVISRTPFSIVVMFAGVALAGICVNDSIVLISFINSLRAKGMATIEAIIEGAAVRLRPIILTSITTIGGLIPMAIGIGGRSETWGPMASTIIFGLFFSTVGTLVVVPCLYGILDDILGRFGRKMRFEESA